MTSPSLISEPLPRTVPRHQSRLQQLGVPALLFAITLVSTTTVGMRYMYNFRLGRPPLATSADADILPFLWGFHNLSGMASGLPFSTTLIAILLAHEFGHFFACRHYHVRSTLPYLLPAPSLSGTFGAVIRLRSMILSRAALIVIGSSGPIAGFCVALVAVVLGLGWSTYSIGPQVHVQAPLAVSAIHALLQTLHWPGDGGALPLIVPHPVLSAAWIGLLITALNLIPAGQLDGGHILYAVSPVSHRWSSRVVVATLMTLGVFFWAGWLLWGVILMMPAMRHPRVPDMADIKTWHYALIPICAFILLFAGTYQPFHGYSVLDILHKLPHRYR